ncbi:UDP-glucose 4-epimerase GalE [Methylobacterium sp. P31]
MKIFVTGGAGYVGSHCCKAFAARGWEVVAYDNLSRGRRAAVRWGPLVQGDLLDREMLRRALAEHRPDAVAHFAALAYVGESATDPALYWRSNTVGSLNLLDAMRETNVRHLIFSSTCASYGIPQRLPIDETHTQAPINPYGWSKFATERVIENYAAAYGLSAVILRYFNAAGCDPAGEIGEDHEPETHAVPLAIRAALGGTPFSIFGTDFETRDGSAIRDYVHVSDLADAHVLAAQLAAKTDGVHVFNLGSETGTSVLELLAAVGRAVGVPVPALRAPRRLGDPPALVATAVKAREVLGWRPVCSSIDVIVETALAWQRSRMLADG